MCCGQKRAMLRSTPVKATIPHFPQNTPSTPRPQTMPQQTPSPTQNTYSSVRLCYLEMSPIRVQGPVTGRLYEFSCSRPVQSVDSRDAGPLLRMRFFRPV